jgi:hypothetical protein
MLLRSYRNTYRRAAILLLLLVVLVMGWWWCGGGGLLLFLLRALTSIITLRFTDLGTKHRLSAVALFRFLLLSLDLFDAAICWLG